MRHSVIIGACQETLPKLRRGDIEEAGRAEPKSRELQGCVFEQYFPHAPPDEQSTSEPKAQLCGSALRLEAERSTSGAPETICRDRRACLVATRPRGVN